MAGLIDADDVRMFGQVGAETRLPDEALLLEGRLARVAVEAARSIFRATRR